MTARYRFPLPESLKKSYPKINKLDKVINIILAVTVVFYGGMLLQDTVDIHNNALVIIEHRQLINSKETYTPILITHIGKDDYMQSQVSRHRWLAGNLKNKGLKVELAPYIKNKKEMPVVVNVPISTWHFVGGMSEGLQQLSRQWTSLGPEYRITVSRESYWRSFKEAMFNTVLEW